MNIATYINSPELYQKSAEIGKNYNLDIDAVGELQLAIINVLDGQTKPSTLEKTFQELFKIDIEDAIKLATDVRTTIFPAVQNELDQLYASPAIHEEAFKPTPAPQAIKPVFTPPTVQEAAPEPIPEPVAPAPVAEVEALKVAPTEAVQYNTPEGHQHNKIPAVEEEREVTIRKIVTPNAILNRQLEVPIVHHEPVAEVQAPKPTPAAPVAPQPIPEAIQPTPAPVAPAPAHVTPTQVPSIPQAPQASSGIIGARMNSTTGMPQEKLDLAKPKQEELQHPPRYTNDPYREPIE